jgi:hypothetical protein
LIGGLSSRADGPLCIAYQRLNRNGFANGELCARWEGGDRRHASALIGRAGSSSVVCLIKGPAALSRTLPARRRRRVASARRRLLFRAARLCHPDALRAIGSAPSLTERHPLDCPLGDHERRFDVFVSRKIYVQIPIEFRARSAAHNRCGKPQNLTGWPATIRISSLIEKGARYYAM